MTLPWVLIVLPALVWARLPTAPYNVKLFCRVGKSFTPQALKPSLCPTSSTSCGYLEFSHAIMNDSKTGIFECLDSSILMKEAEDYNDHTENPYYSICNHRPKCQRILVSDLNKQFLSYFERTQQISATSIRGGAIRFCCSLSHSNLDKLVRLGVSALELASTTPMRCNRLRCAAGSVGCLYHEKLIPKYRPPPRRGPVDYYIEDNVGPYESDEDATAVEDPIADEFEIKPVEMNWDESGISVRTSKFLEIGSLSRRRRTPMSREAEDESSSTEADYNDGYQCVQQHLNDEVYRYCLMIYSQKTSSRCIELHGHKICCCLVAPDETTCNPLESAVSVLPTAFSDYENKFQKNHTSTPIKFTATHFSPPTTRSTFIPAQIEEESEKSADEEQPSEFDSDTTTTTQSTVISINQRTRCRTVTLVESRQYGTSTKSRSRKRIVCDDIRPTVNPTSTSSARSSVELMGYCIATFLIGLVVG